MALLLGISVVSFSYNRGDENEVEYYEYEPKTISIC